MHELTLCWRLLTISHPNSRMASDGVQHAEARAETDARGDDQSKEEVATAAPEDRVDGTTLLGFRLYAVAIGVSFGALMMSLDVSIIGTVHPTQIYLLHKR